MFLYSFIMAHLSFNQFTALIGVMYASTLLYYYWKLSCVWQREAERALYGMVFFTGIFLVTVISFVFVFLTLKSKEELERQAADIIQKELNKPMITPKPPKLIGRLAKMSTAFLIAFMALHSVMRRTSL